VVTDQNTTMAERQLAENINKQFSNKHNYFIYYTVHTGTCFG